MNKNTLSGYWKANKRKILSNWRNHEFIREKHGFSMLRYIQAVIGHIQNDISGLEHDIEIGEIERYLYRKL